MKWIKLFLLIPFLLWGQSKTVILNSVQPEYITILLDSTDSEIIYYIFPPPAGINSTDRTDISTTAPTSASSQAKNLDFVSNGAMTISVIPKFETAEESDSLYAYVQTLVYDKNLAAWYRSANDTLFLDFDTPGTYSGTVRDYLNWTTNTCYTSEIGGEIMPAAGFALTFVQKATNQAGADTRLYIGFWNVK